jgi:hypothetical protein
LGEKLPWACESGWGDAAGVVACDLTEADVWISWGTGGTGSVAGKASNFPPSECPRALSTFGLLNKSNKLEALDCLFCIFDVVGFNVGVATPFDLSWPKPEWLWLFLSVLPLLGALLVFSSSFILSATLLFVSKPLMGLAFCFVSSSLDEENNLRPNLRPNEAEESVGIITDYEFKSHGYYVVLR